MTVAFLFVGAALAIWGLLGLRREWVWVRTRQPIDRARVGEAWYLGVNAFFVFAGLFVMAAGSQFTVPPVGPYLRWVFAAQGDPIFFLRLAPGYLATIVLVTPLRPRRRVRR